MESLKSYKNVVVTGDININIIPKIDEKTYEYNNRTNYLDILSEKGFLPGHLLPTRGPSCLDHFILKINKSVTSAKIAILNTTITDHSTIILALKNIKTTNNNNKTTFKIDYEGAIKSLANKNLSNLLFSDKPNLIINQLTYEINKSLEENTIKIKIPKNKRILKPWMTPGLLRCIQNRNKMNKKCRQEPHNNVLNITYKRYRNFCNKLIRKVKRKYERELLAKSANNSKSLWHNIKNITHMTNTKTKNYDLLNSKPSPTEAVNSVNDFFGNIGKNLAEGIKNSNDRVDHRNLPLIPAPVSSFVLLDTSIEEVHSVLMGLKSESAPGCDKITTKFLKLAKFSVVPIICHVVNLCFDQGTFPVALKEAIITPVHKGGDKTDVNNYRPISVLNSISKILEKLINTRLISYFDKFNILSDSQYGFRREKSTEDAVEALTSLIVKSLDKGKKCLAVFLDLKKAFDTVSVPILCRKLETIGIRGKPLELLTDYLSCRKQSVKIAEHTSDTIHISYGVPQGSVLGPTLFLVYINDLCDYKLKNGSIFSYADDTALVFSGPSWNEVKKESERGLARVAQWLESNLLTLNTNKTNYICFSIYNKAQQGKEFDLKIHKCNTKFDRHCDCPTIDSVDKTKYLGVIIDQRLSWHPQIEIVAGRVRKLVWIFGILRHIASIDLLKKIYTSLAQSIISYCIPIWGGASKTKYLEVERAQRYLLKVMFFKPRMFPTTLLYSNYQLLTVRQLYIVSATVRLHKQLAFDPKALERRRNDLIPSLQITKTTFASQQFANLSRLMYRKINKLLNIYPKSHYEVKLAVTAWIQTLNYDVTEDIMEYKIR